MGSPLGPTLANAFMSFYEQKWINQCPSHFKPVFYRRYVDDTFVLFKDREHCNSFLKYLNNQHGNIQFTCEMETNGVLPFLDVLVRREGSSLSTAVYRKPTFTGLGMKFTSCLPLSYKVNLVKTLVNRAYQISSSYFNFHEEVCFLKRYFCNNGFPLNVVEKTMGNTITKLVSGSTSTKDRPAFQLRLVTEFWGRSSYENDKII